MSSYPDPSCLGEETWVVAHLATTSFQAVVENDKVTPEHLLQAKQPQFSQSLLKGLALQALRQLHCPSLDSLQDLSVLLEVRGPELDTGVKKLQAEKAPRNLNTTLTELFGVIPGDGDPLQERGTYTCRRCAVVGNSGNLRQSQYGQEIDSHDFVLRMNRAPTAGYESDVGSKTTHHFVYPESYKELAANVSMILIPFKTLDLRWVVTALTTGTINFTYVPVPRKIKVKKEKILVYNPAFMKYIYENWLEHHGRYPSTGLLSLIFALHVCDEVSVYGFGADSKGHWHHYWENNTSGGAFRKTGVHDGDFEFNITLTLASIEKIKFFKGR
ncbi:CMP-N-acetylneuraminate-beta-galactosamide-alpha-2,3-sialyltransferase 1 [Pitangus sulphuratus]|nr:CMP-N-acetylneuraminate-beta-galactosamide-alpha-2,3-sialyltransferase 1 [Pitangus sulphuratus]